MANKMKMRRAFFFFFLLPWSSLEPSQSWTSGLTLTHLWAKELAACRNLSALPPKTGFADPYFSKCHLLVYRVMWCLNKSPACRLKCPLWNRDWYLKREKRKKKCVSQESVRNLCSKWTMSKCYGRTTGLFHRAPGPASQLTQDGKTPIMLRGRMLTGMIWWQQQHSISTP